MKVYTKLTLTELEELENAIVGYSNILMGDMVRLPNWTDERKQLKDQIDSLSFINAKIGRMISETMIDIDERREKNGK